ncbi:MAG: hypothetical protein K5785_01000 [Nitrosarchaeum sp.]|nr:hypothetical protein [Nitrosarchaeum sp.]
MSQEEEKKFRGIDQATGKYFINYGEITWTIRKDGHLPQYTDKIEAIVEKFEKSIKEKEDGIITVKEALKISRECSKEILEIGLVDFNYDDVLAKIGYAEIDKIAVDLKLLFLDVGGLGEYLHSQQQLEKAIRSGFHGLRV